MTPPAAATQAGRLAPRRTPAARRPLRRPPRRVSGPAGGYRQVSQTRKLAAGSGLRLIDRLLRGRAWIVVVGIALAGIVAMQVSMLKLNTGIGRAVERSGALSRDNALLRAQISKLSSVDRIESAATKLGMVMPQAGKVRYLRGGSSSYARRAAVSLNSWRNATPLIPALVDQATTDPAQQGVTQPVGVEPGLPQTVPGQTPETVQTPATGQPVSAVTPQTAPVPSGPATATPVSVPAATTVSTSSTPAPSGVGTSTPAAAAPSATGTLSQ